MITEQQALAKMKTDIRLRGFSQNTFRMYTSFTGEFLKYCNRPVDHLSEIDVRRFLGHLITERKLKPATVNIYSAAIRFFFAVTLNRKMNYLQIPRMKTPKTFPVILTKAEIQAIIDECSNTKHKALLLMLYGSGLRASELVSLKVKDIDSKSMRVFVNGGKGKKDRYTILSDNALNTLRDYWRKYRPKSQEGYLFPGSKNIGYLSVDAVASAINKTVIKANINKPVSPHTFRHCFATHLLEDGHSLLQIKEMLGHYCIQSTTIYLHLANTTNGVTSPADNLTAGTFEAYSL